MITSSKTNRLGTEPVSRLLFSMGLQTTAATLFYSLYTVIDTIYVARGLGSHAVGGLAVSFPLLLLLAGLTTTLGSGAASLVSRALGSNDRIAASKATAQAFLVFYSVAVLISIAGLIWLDPLLNLMGVTPEIAPYARDYLQVMLAGSITSTAFSSIIRAEGNTRFAMLLWIIPVAANLALDPVFIFSLRGGVRGAALATLASQAISVVMGVYYFFVSGKSVLHFSWSSLKPDISKIKTILTIGLPSLIQMVSSSLAIVIVNNILRTIGGSLAISSFGIVFRLLAFLTIPLTGLVQALQPIIGFNAGAGHHLRVRQSIQTAVRYTMIYGVFVTLLMQLFPEFWISLFSVEFDIINLSSQILKIIILLFTLSGIAMITTTHFQAIGRPRPVILYILLQQFLIFIPLIILLSNIWGLTGVWYAYPLTGAVSAAIGVFMLRSHLVIHK